MQLHLTTFVWAWLASCASAFIVPEELVSFLSIVYSNIPPIKKGTDSRVGLGFRLGPHADAQIVLELGPQTNTQPLGNSPNAIPDSRKRHTHAAGLDPLDQDGQDGTLHQVVSAPGSHSNVAASNWLSTWRTSILKQHHGGGNSNSQQSELSDPLLTEPEKQADPTKLSGEPLVFHLRKLYRSSKIPKPDVAQGTTSSSTTTTSPSSTDVNAGLSAAPPTHIFKPAFKLRKPGPKASLNKVTLGKPAAPRNNLSDVTVDD